MSPNRVRAQQHVELPRVEHQLHRARIDDAVVDGNASFVGLRDVARGLEEDAGQRLQHVGLVHDRDLLPTVAHRIVERVLRDATGTRARVHARGDRHRLRIVVDRDEVLECDVEAFEVLADQHEVDLVVAAREQRACGADVRVELELLAQADVDRAETASDRRGQRPLERKAGAANAFERRGGEWVARGGNRRHAGLLRFPRERRAECFEDALRHGDDLGADAIAGDERRGNFLGHSLSMRTRVRWRGRSN